MINLYRHYYGATEAEIWRLPRRLIQNDLVCIGKIHEMFNPVDDKKKPKDVDPALTDREQAAYGLENPPEKGEKGNGSTQTQDRKL